MVQKNNCTGSVDVSGASLLSCFVLGMAKSIPLTKQTQPAMAILSRDRLSRSSQSLPGTKNALSRTAYSDKMLRMKESALPMSRNMHAVSSHRFWLYFGTFGRSSQTRQEEVTVQYTAKRCQLWFNGFRVMSWPMVRNVSAWPGTGSIHADGSAPADLSGGTSIAGAS